MGLETHRDPRLTALGNDLSDAVHKAIAAGLEPDFVCSALIAVAADYWNEAYTTPCTGLAGILESKAGRHG